MWDISGLETKKSRRSTEIGKRNIGDSKTKKMNYGFS